MESEHEIIEVSSDEDGSEKDRVPKEAVELSSVKKKEEETDDDCLILDRLPENEAEGVKRAELGSEIVDEMLIVGEKGQVMRLTCILVLFLVNKLVFFITVPLLFLESSARGLSSCVKSHRSRRTTNSRLFKTFQDFLEQFTSEDKSRHFSGFVQARFNLQILEPLVLALGGVATHLGLIFYTLLWFACRDYPHPRYLCATFLFSLTPHKKHCQLCHCYVCDCPAPCINWASHCNATHKENLWRLQRQSFKKQKREKLHLDANANASLSRSKMQISRAATSFPPPNESKPKTDHRSSIRHTQTAMASQPASSKEATAPCSKDILCEIYKICPVVISCRRKIPPPYPLPEPPEADEGD